MLFGMFGAFGRKKELHMIDEGLRRHAVISSSVPESVKIALWKRVRDRNPAPEEKEGILNDLGAFLAYLCQGHEDFSHNLDPDLASGMARRVDLAETFDESLDAETILLSLYAGLAHEDFASRFSIEETEGEE